MRLKSKFSIGDQVYCLRNKYILPYIIKSIDISVSNVPNPLIQELYGLKPLLPNADDAIVNTKVFGNEIFKSKTELINKLFYVMNHPGNEKALRDTKFSQKIR